LLYSGWATYPEVTDFLAGILENMGASWVRESELSREIEDV
jgi:hypothetical protein